MRKYGFDYLVEKAQLLMEMPAQVSRPETNPNVVAFKTSGKKGGQGIAKKISETLFQNWKPSGTAKIFNEYIAELLYRHNESHAFPYSSIVPYAKELIKSDEPFDLKKNTASNGDKIETFEQDFRDFVGTGNVDTGSLTRWALSYLMNKAEELNPGYLNSAEFFESATNPELVKSWTESYYDRKASIANRSTGYQKQVKDLYQVSAGEYAKMRSEVWPIIVKINRRTARMAPKSNPKRYALDTVIAALEGLISEVPGLIKHLGSLLKNFKQASKSGNILSKEEIESELENTLDPIDKDLSLEVFDEFDFLYEAGLGESENDEYSNHVDSKIRDRMVKNKLENYNDDFLNDVVEKGIISEDEKDIVNKWKNLILHVTEDPNAEFSKEERSEYAKMNREYAYKKQGEKWKAEKAEKEAAKKSGIKRDDGLGDLSVSELESKLEELLDSEDPDFTLIDKVEKRIEKLRKSGITEDYDSGVMGYFSEQVRKDQHINNIGEYKDRGFKKAQNYHQWMLLNGM
jgi:hypothetical protein